MHRTFENLQDTPQRWARIWSMKTCHEREYHRAGEACYSWCPTYRNSGNSWNRLLFAWYNPLNYQRRTRYEKCVCVVGIPLSDRGFNNGESEIRYNSGGLTWVKHSSRKSSATHSCRCVQYFPVSEHWMVCGCQCSGFLTCTEMLMHAIARASCTDTVRESVGEKSLAAPGTRTFVSTAPGFSVQLSYSRTNHNIQ